VVITRNEEARIGRCLSALQLATAEIGGAEIVVADSASTDRTVELALSHGARVVVLRPEWELSPSAGRYVGFHCTSGELIMFVDADTVIDRHWFPAAISAFTQRDVAAVTGWLDDVDEQDRPLPYVGSRSNHIRLIEHLRGIGMYRRAALARAGTFNPFLVTEEEAELALRLRSQGWKLLQLPHQMGRHERGAQLQAEIMRAWRLGRFKGMGKTLRYALRAGNGLGFCFNRLLPTIAFVTGLISLLALGTGLELHAVAHGWKIAAGLLLFWMMAVAIRKRSLTGALAYIVRNTLTSYGLIAGFLSTTIKAPEQYPLDVIETESPSIRAAV
jgi:glycosyltransferase involved in cell wall biosynthesis